MGMPAAPHDVTTLEEFFSLPEDNTRRHELLDGVYVVSPPPSYRHQHVVMALYRCLTPALESHPDLLLFPVLGDIVLAPRTVVQPDLFVIPKPASRDVRWRDIGRPVLAIEVLSPTTAARDRGTKRQLYQEAGVPEYWIIDIDSRLVERWRPGDERPEVLRERLVWQPPGSSDSLEIDLFKFFSRTLDG
jgi:Uma2 family endonuclease